MMFLFSSSSLNKQKAVATIVATMMFVLTKLVTTADAVCFNDTESMLMAQVEGIKQLEICPDTTLSIGVPISADLSEWSGQIPLVILGDDVEVYCGPDKSASNNCVLEGGVLQLVTTVVNPLLPSTTTASTNNLLVSGITFKGVLTDIPPLLGTSVNIGAPGANIVFEDCTWEDMTAQHIFLIERNSFTTAEDYPPKSAEITVRDSFFRDVDFGQAVIRNNGQTLTVQNTIFENILYSPLCNCPQAYAMALTAESSTTLVDVTFTNVEALTSLILQAGEGTELTAKEDNDLNVIDFTIYDMTNRNGTDFCEGGLVVDTVVNGILDTCQDIRSGDVSCLEEDGSPCGEDDGDGGDGDGGATDIGEPSSATSVWWLGSGLLAAAASCTFLEL